MSEEEETNYWCKIEKEVEEKVTEQIRKDLVAHQNTEIAIASLRPLISEDLINQLKDELRGNLANIDETMLTIEAQRQIDTHVLLPLAQKLLSKR